MPETMTAMHRDAHVSAMDRRNPLIADWLADSLGGKPDVRNGPSVIALPGAERSGSPAFRLTLTLRDPGEWKTARGRIDGLHSQTIGRDVGRQRAYTSFLR